MADPDLSKWRFKPKHPLPSPRPIVPPSSPVPNPHGINPGYQNIDISDELFDSDGDETTWPTTSKKTRGCDKKFLALLTKAYNGRPDLVSQWSKSFLSYLSPYHYCCLSWISKWFADILQTQAVNPSFSKANHPKATLYSKPPT